jgi:MFS transporter, ACS family, allantoate permease
MEKRPGGSLTELDRERDADGPGVEVHEILLEDADEALGFLSKHSQAESIAEAGQAILEDPQRLKNLVRKVDLAIIPLLGCIYLLQYLDKTTLTYTAVMGIREDAHLVGNQYSELALLFYVGKNFVRLRYVKNTVLTKLGYLVAEFPTQFLAQRVSRLAFYLGVNIILWGIVLMCHAACSSFTGLAICRTLLGVFESCVIPILVLITAMWYRKEEQGRRISWFYVFNCVAQIIGGLMSYGVSFTHGPFASWRVFYVVIGGFTILVGILVCLFLPDSPVKAKRFSDEEKVAILLRVKDNHR